MLKGYFNRADDARVNVLRHILSSGGSRPLTVLNVTPPFRYPPSPLTSGGLHAAPPGEQHAVAT